MSLFYTITLYKVNKSRSLFSSFLLQIIRTSAILFLIGCKRSKPNILEQQKGNVIPWLI